MTGLLSIAAIQILVCMIAGAFWVIVGGEVMFRVFVVSSVGCGLYLLALNAGKK